MAKRSGVSQILSIRSPMLTKNAQNVLASKNCTNIWHYSLNLIPTYQIISVTNVQRETLIAILFTDLCSIDKQSTLGRKCVKFAITNGQSINCPRKYWMTDQKPKRIRTILEVQNFGLWFTPLISRLGYDSEVIHDLIRINWFSPWVMGWFESTFSEAVWVMN